jgi:hypothetical protein
MECAGRDWFRRTAEPLARRFRNPDMWLVVLKLPPFFEARRNEIEAVLPELDTAELST